MPDGPAMIVTIDGPAGAGKSSAARALAARLGFEYLDTGAMFRTVALAALRAGLDPTDGPGVGRLLECGLRLDQASGRFRLAGEDVTEAIRSPEVSAASSRIAVLAEVRAFLATEQRRVAAGRRMVCEGRDQGTAVFPDAACKFFLTADPLERARRRQRERAARGESIAVEDVLREQQERDRRDAGRAIAPLCKAADAIEVDTTHLSPAEVLDRLEQEVRRRHAG
jgi:cytidylate kinase